MLKRSIKCPKCGASKESSDSAMAILCDFCGAFVAVATEQIWAPENISGRTREAMRRALDPTAVEARWQELADVMRSAKSKGDREAWRIAAEEFYTLYPLACPEVVPVGRREGRRLAGWVRESVAVAELGAFDPALRRLEAECGRIIAGLYSGADAYETARAYLATRLLYERKLACHPDYPPGLDQRDPENTARELLRTILQGQGLMIPDTTMQRIRVELLGEKPIDVSSTCDNCGALIDGKAVEAGRCPFCGGRMAFAGDDGRLQSLLANFAAMAPAIADERALAVTAVNLPMMPLFSGGETPPADCIARYLEKAWEGREPSLLFEAIEALRPLAKKHAGLGELLADVLELLRGDLS